MLHPFHLTQKFSAMSMIYKTQKKIADLKFGIVSMLALDQCKLGSGRVAMYVMLEWDEYKGCLKGYIGRLRICVMF